jgi:hypothetical protein
MKAYWGSGGITPFFDLGTRWRWVVSFTLRPLYSQRKSPWYPLDKRLVGPQSYHTKLSENLKGANHSGDLDADGSIILTGILNEKGVRMWLYSCGSGCSPVTGSCEHDNKPSGSKKKRWRNFCPADRFLLSIYTSFRIISLHSGEIVLIEKLIITQVIKKFI